MEDKRLTANEIHELAIMPLPRIETIAAKLHGGGSIMRKQHDNGGLYSHYLVIEGYSFDRTNK